MNIIDLRGKLPVHASRRYNSRKLADIRSIAIHHSLTTQGSAEAFAGYHVRTNGWPGIGYAYVVGRDGAVYQCWDHTVVSYHVGNSNRHALGICMVGDFRTQQPTAEQYEATLELVRNLQKQLPNAVVVKGHSEYPDYAWKACPVISMDKFRRDLLEGIEEAMTPEERKVVDDLMKQVRDLTVRLEQQAAAQTVANKRDKAPDWFVKEFGSGDLGGRINDPFMNKEGWRAVTATLRAVGYGNGRGLPADIR
jgi:hypothetical protein